MSIKINIKSEDLVIVFHHNDQDGALAGSIIKHYYQQTFVYTNMVDYSKQYDLNYFIRTINEIIKHNSNCNKAVVYFVDYTCPNLDQLYQNCKDNDIKLVWIDHHISTIEKYKNIDCEGIRSIEHSGCYLTWKYFYSNAVEYPLIVKYVDLFDRHDLTSDIPFENITSVILFLDSFDLNLSECESSVYPIYIECLNNDDFLDNIIKQGQIILKYTKQQSINNSKNIYECKLNDQINCLVLNTWQHGSWLFDNKIKDKDYLLVTWFIDGNNQYKYSFYSDENSSIDCSKIASSLGGGGHKHAAGCQLDYFIFN